jgi:hypothetical protein
MLSPFTTVDHRIDSVLPFEERRVLRRSAPERLRFEPPGPTLIPTPVASAPRPIRRPSRLRVWLGERLVALGHRLAGPDITS